MSVVHVSSFSPCLTHHHHHVCYLEFVAAAMDGHLVKMSEFVPTLPKNDPVVFIVGAYAHGEMKDDYAEEKIAFSEYPLSASGACAKICNAFEDIWEIL